MDGNGPKRCLNCDYMLEHLPEPRCPECGRTFDLADPTTYRVTRPFRVEPLVWTVLAVIAPAWTLAGPRLGMPEWFVAVPLGSARSCSRGAWWLCVQKAPPAGGAHG